MYSTVDYEILCIVLWDYYERDEKNEIQRSCLVLGLQGREVI